MQVSDQPVNEWLDSIDDPRADDIRTLDALITDNFAEDSRVLRV